MADTPNRTRSRGFTLYLSDDEEALLAAHCARLGVSKAALLRLLIRGALTLPPATSVTAPEQVAA
jgi:hypothetical protein